MPKSNEELQNEYNKSYAQTRGHSEIHGSNERNPTGSQRSSSSNGGGGSCFPAGTPVLTPSGSGSIENLHAGDLVLAYDDLRQQFRTAAIRRVRRFPQGRIVHLQMNDGSLIATTARHSFRCGGAWRQASALQPGDRLAMVKRDGRIAGLRIVSVVDTGRTEPVFNLIVDDPHHYIASGALAHSFTRWRALRSWWCRCSARLANPSAAALPNLARPIVRSLG